MINVLADSTRVNLVIYRANLAITGDGVDGLAVGVNADSIDKFERWSALCAPVGVVEAEGREGDALSL